MCLLSGLVDNLYSFLLRGQHIEHHDNSSIIRRHTRKLTDLGDLSFPLSIRSWSSLLDVEESTITILDYCLPEQDLDAQLRTIIQASNDWSLKIKRCVVLDTNVAIYLDRTFAFEHGIKEVQVHGYNYGFTDKIFSKGHSVVLPVKVKQGNTEKNLTDLRMEIVRRVLLNIINKLTEIVKDSEPVTIQMVTDTVPDPNHVSCGPVLSGKGKKDTTTTAQQLYQKRTVDLQLIAQHKYRVKSTTGHCSEYFENLGRGSVTIEMLQNQPRKPMKLELNCVQGGQKGAPFIFYNCARLSALFKAFDKMVESGLYPPLTPMEEIHFDLLKIEDEWELLFIFILQFPHIVASCVQGIHKGIVQPHNLIGFLSRMSGCYSVYYRSVKILLYAKEQVFPVVHARICLLKAVQQIFHNALDLLDIEPIREM